ncbi:MAG: LacI family transcriptional regulator [Clostridia bacterium]|nr:LacI family transcriptional regulator [Clostridia bacterium]
MNIRTLKQIAEELGLSISTVSRAVNGKSVVKEETRLKVMKLAEKYAYSPNEVARALQKSSTQMIAVVLPDVSETFFGTIVNEIDRVVSQKKYMLILADKEPVKGLHLIVPAQRVLCFRMDLPFGEEQYRIPFWSVFVGT